MRKYILLFLLVCFSGHSQIIYSLHDDKRIIDSMKLEIKTTKSDSLKSILNFKLANIYLKDGKKDLYLSHLNYGLKAAGKNKFLNDVYYYFSSSKYMFDADRRRYQKALDVAEAHLKKYHFKQVYSFLAMIYHCKYINLTLMNKPELGFKVLLEQAVPMAKKADDSELLGIMYKSIAVTFINQLKYDKGEYYIKEGIRNLERQKRTSAANSENLIESYLLYAELLIDKKKLQHVNALLSKAKRILDNHPNSNIYPSYYQTKGYLEHTLGRYNEALADYNQGIKQSKILGDSFAIIRLSQVKYATLKELKRYTEARDLLIAILSSKDINIEDKTNCIKELSWIYKQLNDFSKALNYSEEYIRLSDSVKLYSYQKDIASLEAKYNNAENQKMIQSLELQKQKILVNEEKNKLYNILHITILFVAIFFLAAIAFFFWNESKNKANLAKEREINYNQNLDSLKSQKTLEVMQAMIDGQEKERSRVARDLHDGVGSMLSSLKMQMAQKIESNHNKEDFKGLIDLLSSSISELRQVAFNMVPEVLLKLGLEDALKDLCYSMETDKVKIYFTATEIKSSLTKTHQITIFRIVQELLNNALKHSCCSEIIIDCSQNDNLFLIVIEDNGIGMMKNETETVKGLGLNNISNRIQLYNGKMEIQSEPAKGTEIYIELCFSEVAVMEELSY